MNLNFRPLRRALSAALALLCLPAVTACLTDDADPADVAPATLSLHLVAQQEGDLNAQRATEAGTTGEYLSAEICVLLVGADNVVVRKFLTTDELADDATAQTGDLREWTSQPFELEPGAYHVYAFANWSTVQNAALNSFVGIAEGENLATLAQQGVDIGAIVLDNPAAKLNPAAPNAADRRFIPMSADTTVYVTSATTQIDVGLDRLVSKLRLTVDAKAIEQNGSLTALTFAATADRVGLFKGQAVPDAQRTQTVTIDFAQLTPADDGRYYLSDIYVNETAEGDGFRLTLATTQRGGTTYYATTARTSLPRNAIYPLTLVFSNYEPELRAESWVSPIGALPTPVVADLDAEYRVDLAEGCQFAFTVGGLTAEADVSDVSCQWTLPESAQGYAALDGDADALTVRGHISAQAGLQFPLYLDLAWTRAGQRYERRYTIRITTVNIWDVTPAASAVGVMRQLFPESVQILNQR